MERKQASDFDQELLDLYDDYAHGRIERRVFLQGAAKFAAGGLTAAALLASLAPNYAWAQQVAKDDPRLKTEYLKYPSPKGSGTMRGYLAWPASAQGRWPAVLVIHENRGLNPYVVGFCYGGGVANTLAVRIPDVIAAAAPFYGSQPAAADVPKIKASLLLHYAELDKRINAGWPAYENALKAAKVRYSAHIYKGANHGFHNDTTPRYDEAAAKLAWQRTIDFFNANLR